MKKITKLILALFGLSLMLMAFQNFGSVDLSDTDTNDVKVQKKKNNFTGRSQKGTIRPNQK